MLYYSSYRPSLRGVVSAEGECYILMVVLCFTWTEESSVHHDEDATDNVDHDNVDDVLGMATYARSWCTTNIW